MLIHITYCRLTCECNRLYCMCKHVVKVISLCQGYTDDAQINQVLATRAGTSMIDKLHRNAATQAEVQIGSLAELEDILALTSAASEQETAAATPSASISMSFHQHELLYLHLVMAAQQHMPAETGCETWLLTMARCSSLVTHLNRTEGLGLAPKPATKLVQHIQWPMMGPRQVKAAAAQQENSSAAAKAMPDAKERRASKATMPNAAKFEKCGTCHHCSHPKLNAFASGSAHWPAFTAAGCCVVLLCF